MPQTPAASAGFANPVATQKLLHVAHQAYLNYPNNCSGAVHYVIKSLVDPKAPYLLANQFLQWLANPANGWRRVTMKEASNLANRGVVVVAGLPEPGGHGHVVIVLPGPWKPSGGYKANGQMMASHGNFPPIMSTSLGAWPGAMSDGDKTLYDPWANVKHVRAVTLWAKEQ